MQDKIMPDIVNAVIGATFGRGKELRSLAYRNGVRLGLELKLRGLPLTPVQLTGTATDDAMEAGMRRAAELWANLPEEALMPPETRLPLHLVESTDELPPPMAAPVLTRTQVRESWES